MSRRVHKGQVCCHVPYEASADAFAGCIVTQGDGPSREGRDGEYKPSAIMVRAHFGGKYLCCDGGDIGRLARYPATSSRVFDCAGSLSHAGIMCPSALGGTAAKVNHGRAVIGSIA